MTQLSAEECGVFSGENYSSFPVSTSSGVLSGKYTYDAAGHALGDIGEVSKKDIEADNYYIRGDYIGKQGIEKSYEKYLRGGKKGWRFCFVMRMDVFRGIIWMGSSTVPLCPVRT